MRFLVRHPVLRPTTVYFSAIAILCAGVLDLLVFLLKKPKGNAAEIAAAAH